MHAFASDHADLSIESNWRPTADEMQQLRPVRELLERLRQRLPLSAPVPIALSGFHCWTGTCAVVDARGSLHRL
jgi:hypothetical protein